MWPKLFRWTGFGVLGSLSPLLLNYFLILLTGTTLSPQEAIKHGELFIVISSMCAVSLGELIGTNLRRTNISIIVATLTIVILLLSTGLYAAIPLASGIKQDITALASYVLFGVPLFYVDVV